MNTNTIVKEILSASKTSLEQHKLANNKAISGYVLGTEGLDKSSEELAISALSSIETSVEDTISLVMSQAMGDKLSQEHFETQITAAKKIAGLAIDPNVARQSLTSLKDISSMYKGASVVPNMSVVDALMPGELSTEAFDDQAINNAIFYSIAYNFAASRQDAFGEAFFPTIVVDPTHSGILVETEVISLMSEVERSIDGTPNKKLFNKKVITKAIYDNDLLDNNRNKVVPVYSAGVNENLFLKDYTFTDETSGTAITTAPLLFGETINILGISQNSAMLAKGTMDHTDTLDRTINLEDIFVTLEGKDVNGDDVKELIKVPVSIFPFSNFTYTTQDHWKDMKLDFNTTSIILNSSSVKTVTGEASKILAALNASNHKFKLEVKIHGDANVEYGDATLYASSIRLVEVRNAAGELILPTDASYVDYKTIFDTIKLAGYTLEAYRTNSNLRTNGQLVTNDKFSQIYNVPLRTGFSVMLPVGATGKELSPDSLSSLISYSGLKVNLAAVRKLTEFAATLSMITNNGTNKEVELDTIGRHHVYPYSNEVTFALSAQVDSLRSADREEDIRMSLISNIKNEAIKMGIESNYNIVYDVMRGNMGGKKTLVIGTDPRIEQYLTKNGENKIELSSTLDAVVVSSHNPALSGKMFMSYSIFDEQRNVAVNPLSFGAHLWAPTIATDIVVTQGGSTRRAINTVPRFLHIVNIPILTTFTVSDIDEVLGKVTIKTN